MKYNLLFEHWETFRNLFVDFQAIYFESLGMSTEHFHTAFTGHFGKFIKLPLAILELDVA